jgi:hypothetical protein
LFHERGSIHTDGITVQFATDEAGNGRLLRTVAGVSKVGIIMDVVAAICERVIIHLEGSACNLILMEMFEITCGPRLTSSCAFSRS